MFAFCDTPHLVENAIYKVHATLDTTHLKIEDEGHSFLFNPFIQLQTSSALLPKQSLTD
jgi:hypothetical protein